MKKLRTAAWLAVISLVAVYAGFWFAQQTSLSGGTAKPAPDLALTDLSGKVHKLSDYRGKLLLVNFWASWCSPCIEEIPHLIEAENIFSNRGLRIIAPAMDERESIDRIIQQMRVSYPVMADYAQVDAAMRALGNTQGGLPYSVLISADGKIVQQLLGGLKRDELFKLVESSLPAS